jgi:hypothetical protein
VNKGALLLDFRLFVPISLVLFGFLLGAWSGRYFYRERYVTGAFLSWCGWSCGLWAWWIVSRAML